jgi:hypothetical protein
MGSTVWLRPEIENRQILRPNDPWIAAEISAPSAPL